MNHQEFIARLGGMLGSRDVLSSRADCATYGYDASVFQGEEIVAVAFPESAAEVAQDSSVSPVRRSSPMWLAAAARGSAEVPFPRRAG